MTFMEEATRKIDELDESKSFDDAMKYIKHLCYEIVDSNKCGRALDRAMESTLSKRKITKIHKNVICQKFAGDEYSEQEEKFFNKLLGIEDLE